MHKQTYGQYNTRNATWLTTSVKSFLAEVDFNKIVDPFAGQGDLLQCFHELDVPKQGYDIDPLLCKLRDWQLNDSLASITRDECALCVTNPPYLANNTAKRFHRSGAYHWFDDNPELYDLYLIGLSRCLSAFNNVIAIVPETFLQTGLFRDRLVLVDILEKNPFDDTDFPTLIGCWSKNLNRGNNFQVFKNEANLGTWRSLRGCIPSHSELGLKVKFNRKDGQIGLIGIDGTKANDQIAFCDVETIGEDEIKVSSRLRTRIWISYSSHIPAIIEECNDILAKLRQQTSDVVLSPFKANNICGLRRRRLDYDIAKHIIHQAVANTLQSMKSTDAVESPP
jgi:hypothetical protein